MYERVAVVELSTANFSMMYTGEVSQTAIVNSNFLSFGSEPQRRRNPVPSL